MFRGFWKLAWVETKIFAREPMGFIGTLITPVLAFIILGRSFGVSAARARVPDVDVPFNVAILAAVFIAIGAVQSLVAIMSIYREGGILKRLRATPLRPYTILSAHVLVKLLFTVASLSLMQGIWNGESWFAHLGDLAALAVFGALFVALSARVFRWE